MSLVDYSSTSESEDEQDYLQNSSFKLNQNCKQIRNSKTHGTIKIGIPSLSDFYNEEEIEGTGRKKSKQLLVSTSLLAILPSPKRKPISNTSFVPNILNKRARVEKTKSKLQKISQVNKNTSEYYNDDDIEIPETFDDEIWMKACKSQKRSKTTVQEYKTCIPQKQNGFIQLAPEVHKPCVGLNIKAFRDIVEQKRKLKENVRDEHEDEICPEKEQWLKSFTDPKYEPQITTQNPVNNTCRIKNHITALAQKALANDQELKLKWSENKHNRRLTRAKYGF